MSATVTPQRRTATTALALARLLSSRSPEHVARVAERWASELERRDALITRVRAVIERIPDELLTADAIVALDLLRRFDAGPIAPPAAAPPGHTHEWAEGEYAVIFRCTVDGCTAHEVSVECAGCGFAYLPEDVREVGDEWLCAGCAANEEVSDG